MIELKQKTKIVHEYYVAKLDLTYHGCKGCLHYMLNQTSDLTQVLWG